VGRIFVYGSINMDLVIEADYMPESGETMHGKNFFVNSGGKGANQAVAAALQEGEVLFMGSIGKDANGKILKESLESYSVDTSSLNAITDTSSGIAMILNIEGDNRIILDGGANLVDTSSIVIEKLIESAVVGDILICQLETNFQSTVRVIQYAREMGMITVFNPAPAIRLQPDIYKLIDYLIINQTESEILTSIHPQNLADCQIVYTRVAEMGTATLIITMGSKGCYICSIDGIEHVPAMKVDDIDTTGAGDAFIGAFSVELGRGRPLLEAAEHATMVAALTVTKKGAQQSMPTRDDVAVFRKMN